MSICKKILVAAIDIGTTHSGWAFSLISDYERDPLRITSFTWPADFLKEIRIKTSTCILFDKNKQFHSFGNDAEEKYSGLVEEEEHQEWYFFKNFQTTLFNKKEQITKAVMLNTADGREMVAIDVFSAAIKFLKGHLLNFLLIHATSVWETEIQWALTTPDIWDDTVKQFLREAAEKVGICGDSLMIVPEPEAASVYCMYKQVQHDNRLFDSGAKYMIIIAEERTVEMTVYEVQRNETLRELYKADRCDWGGTMVNESFLSLLTDIVGKGVMDAFRSYCSYSFIDLLRDFEKKKHTIRPDKMGKITITLPRDLLNTFDENYPEDGIRANIESNPKYKDNITLHKGKMRMESHIAISLFEESCSKIIYHMNELFRYPNLIDVSSILLVGKYAESNVLQANIRKAFYDKMLFVPQPAEYAVLIGAVLYGHRQQKAQDELKDD